MGRREMIKNVKWSIFQKAISLLRLPSDDAADLVIDVLQTLLHRRQRVRLEVSGEETRNTYLFIPCELPLSRRFFARPVISSTGVLV